MRSVLLGGGHEHEQAAGVGYTGEHRWVRAGRARCAGKRLRRGAGREDGLVEPAGCRSQVRVPERGEPVRHVASAPGGPNEAARESMSPSMRQGLGTTWGENRESWVQDTDFVRRSSSPLRVFAVHYNDRAGIQAVLGRDSGSWGDIEAPEVSVELRGEGGALPTARAGSKFYVTGSAGDRYSIFVKNQTGRRLEVVASVDGLDVLNGKEASTRSRGYVVSPYETLEIDGFRQSQGSVAAFRFGGVGESYAATKESGARNVGVIGVAVFEERENRPSAQELRLRNTASPFPASDPRYARPPH